MFKPDQYKEIFDRRADSYHQAMTSWPKARDKEFETLLTLANLQPGQRVLDMPAGGGYLAWYVPNEINLIHIETSTVFANFGLSKTSHPIVVIDNDKFPFAANSIDCFLSLAGLHHVSDKTSLYREIFRVLKPNGTAILADASENGDVAKFLDECVDQYNPMGHQGIYFSENTKQEIEESGLEVKSSNSIKYTWNYDSIESMLDYCRSMFGMTDAENKDIQSGIEKYLGFQIKGFNVEMNWCLSFYELKKPG